MKKGLNSHFNQFVIFLIIISSIMLVIDNPLYNPDDYLMKLLAKVDIFITGLFFCESLIKIIAKGLFFNNLVGIEPYLRSTWNIIDVVVVSGSLINIGFMIAGVNMNSLQALKALRALRGLRPLRMITRNEELRLVVNSMLASVPALANVLLVLFLFILIFSIMGVSFFKGMFGFCTESFTGIAIDMSLIKTKQDCLDQGGIWKNSNNNFDNTINSMLTLF